MNGGTEKRWTITQDGVGMAPKHLISDQGGQFTGDVFQDWCASKLRDIRQRFGAVGEYGSIAVLERCIPSLKTECTRKIRIPVGLEAIRGELTLYVSWYNEFRPHQGLDGRVPMDVCQGIQTRASPIETRGEEGVSLELLVTELQPLLDHLDKIRIVLSGGFDTLDCLIPLHLA